MKSLGSRLVFYYSTVVTLTVGLALVIGFLLVRHHLLSGTDFLLQAEYREVQNMLDEMGPPLTSNRIYGVLMNHTMIDASVFYFQIHNESREQLFKSTNLADLELPDLSGDGEERESRYDTVSFPPLGWLRVAEFYRGDLHIQIATSMDILKSLSSRFSIAMIIGLPVMFLVSVAMGFFLSEVTLRPLRVIQRTARRISVTNLSERIPDTGSRDELSQLAGLLNDMFGRLEKAFQQTRELTAQMSHELRTPLSIIQLHAEKALQEAGDDGKGAAELEEVLQEVRRLEQVIDQLLVLAKADAHALTLNRQSQSTSAFIAQFAEDAAALAEHKQHRFEMGRNDEVQLEFDRAWLRQVLFNLLSNALKFSPEQSMVRLDAMRENGTWQVSLTDQGPGVPDAERERVFEPFKRVNHGGTQVEGAGLGLAVCRSIVELHGGTIRCGRNVAAPGFAVTLRLPIGLRGQT